MINWHNISYLKNGSLVQQKVYQLIRRSGVMDTLSAFSPVLAGTFPIGINIPGSDMDIICEFTDAGDFADVLQLNFKAQTGYSLSQKTIRDVPSVIARFTFENHKFEIFGQPLPVEKQYAYRHMLIEYKLLQENDESFRQQIIALKLKGLSTEEAFAKLLSLKGDPYESLLALE